MGIPPSVGTGSSYHHFPEEVKLLGTRLLKGRPPRAFKEILVSYATRPWLFPAAHSFSSKILFPPPLSVCPCSRPDQIWQEINPQVEAEALNNAPTG
jgi:hypothetical protein